MPRTFFHSTAELVVQVSEATTVSINCTVDFIKSFCDISTDQASGALGLATDIGLIKKCQNNQYSPNSPITKLLSTPEESKKASALRVLLESYEPFIIFRDRLVATNSVDQAAQQTRAKLDLDAHREDIKHTLVSLGTYTKAIESEGGGRYKTNNSDLMNQLKELTEACTNLHDAEVCIRTEIGDYSDNLDRNEVLMPLSQALLKAKEGRGRDAVNEASIAFESFLVRLSERLNVSLTGATGINSKLDRFRTGNHLPKKVVESAKYLGHIRNAADHGVDVDPEVGAIWSITSGTGIQYIFVTCSIIKSCGAKEISQVYLL